MARPYTDEVLEKHGTKESYKVRSFEEDLEDRELIWHRDEETRRVTVLSGDGWKLQLDNNRPILLEKGMTYTIPKMVYHRVIKGQYDLVLRIQDV